MNIIFWNVQRSGHDELGFLEQGIAEIINSTPRPDALVLCELNFDYASNELVVRAREHGWDRVPEAQGPEGDYRLPTSLQTTAIQPTGGHYQAWTIGRGPTESRPGLLLRDGTNNESVIAVHLPAQGEGPFDPVPPVRALGNIAQSFDALPKNPPVIDLRAIVGDFNVDCASQVVMDEFNREMALNRFAAWRRIRPGRATHRGGKTLDWALVHPTIATAFVDRFTWNAADQDPGADYVPTGGNQKQSDHWPIRLHW